MNEQRNYAAVNQFAKRYISLNHLEASLASSALCNIVSLTINIVTQNFWISKEKFPKRISLNITLLLQDLYITFQLFLQITSKNFWKLFKQLGQIII